MGRLFYRTSGTKAKKVGSSFYFKGRHEGNYYVGGSYTASDPNLELVRGIVRINSDGSFDSSFSVGSGFNTPVIYTVVHQSDGKILVGGFFTSYNGTTSNSIIRLNSDGSVDSSFNIGSGFEAVLSIAIQSDNKILIGGEFTTYNDNNSSNIIRLNSDGSIDSGFSIGTGFNFAVQSVVIQSNGKILVGGYFTSYNGTSTNYIVRLNSDGSIDSGFSIGTGFNNIVSTIAIQSDNKILVGGQFTTYNGNARNRIIRLNSDGSIDSGFSIGTGFNFPPESIFIQNDGKIVVGGFFTSYNDNSRNRIIRLNSDGSVDSGFSIGTGFDSAPQSIFIQNDGKIVVGGFFSSYDENSRNRMVRLNSDGTEDTGFNIGIGFNSIIRKISLQSDNKILAVGQFTIYNGNSRNRIISIQSDNSINSTFNIGTGFNNTVDTIALDSNNKLICGGAFTSYDGNSRNRIIRLNSDGSVDSGFSIGTGFNSGSYIVVIQTDGKILVGGNFTSYNENSRNRIIRLNSDGSVDSGFSIGTGFNNWVRTIAIQSDNKILVGGQFTTYNGNARNRIIRLNSDGSIDSGFSIGTGFNNTVWGISLQSDNKILVVGDFTTYDSNSRNRIIRLNSDGSVDSGFSIGTGLNAGTYQALEYQNSILVCGNFTSYNGTSRDRILKLNNDGSLDSSFVCDMVFSALINSFGIQSDGKILAGGNFVGSLNNEQYGRFVRLNFDGTVDTSYKFDFNSNVSTVAIE
jgi:uncharacterized delta-60 repeat protein